MAYYMDLAIDITWREDKYPSGEDQDQVTKPFFDPEREIIKRYNCYTVLDHIGIGIRRGRLCESMDFVAPTAGHGVVKSRRFLYLYDNPFPSYLFPNVKSGLGQRPLR